ncbi:MAG: recombinase family protein [Cyanobacteria bacterium J06632_22]
MTAPQASSRDSDSQDQDKASVWQRLQAGRAAKAAQGGYVGYGSPAYGERVVNGELTQDEREQQVIELIRRHHKSGKSLQQIANWMNDQGYTTKRGRQWQRISIKRVLDRLYGRANRKPSSVKSSLESTEEAGSQ